jgi:hypothetical protein
MDAFNILLIIGIFGTTSLCAWKVGKKVSAPLRERNSKWAAATDVAAFAISFVLFAMAIFLVVAMTFGR